jgi:uncharacterized protein
MAVQEASNKQAQAVTFRHGPWDIAAHLHLPPNFSHDAKYSAVIVGHPITGCKEQTAGLYASQLAEAGYAALAYDACFQGASGGEPRHLEHPGPRVEDFHCAVDYLSAQDFVDMDSIGVLGICGSGGYSVTATMSDHRVKALGVVSPVCYGRLLREGGLGGPAGLELLHAVDAQRTAEARGGDPLVPPIIPASPEDATGLGVDLENAVNYYRTPRARHERAPNTVVFARQQAGFVYDAFHLAEHLLTQPLLVIVGGVPGALGSYRDGYTLYNKARSEQKELVIVDGANHFDLYDKPNFQRQAMDKLKAFFAEHL